MAVVFISPKQRQKMFFTAITIVFLLILLIFTLSVFLSKPKTSSVNLVFNKPKVDINMGLFESEEFQNLQPFMGMELQFQYTAHKQGEDDEDGFVYAESEKKAREILQELGYIISKLKEVQKGRDNPFTPYF